MHREPDRRGSCHCGAIRYRVAVEPVEVVLCHCESCRRSSGAPAVAWAMVPLAAFEIERGEFARYASSEGVSRGFCSTCGTTLCFEATYMEGFVDVTVASFEDPEGLPPTMHIWEAQRVGWLSLADAWPRHAELPPQEG